MLFVQQVVPQSNSAWVGRWVKVVVDLGSVELSLNLEIRLEGASDPLL